jgi:hypothetical protein
MLDGAAVVAIWNDVVPEGLAAFHAWHITEHMPERVAIPGFRRGRRYVSPGNPCSFFTLYEVETLGVLSGAAYTARLNAPTPATQANIVNFRNTIRSLAAVVASAGAGLGGALMTLRFEAEDGAALAALVPGLAAGPRMLGAHLCHTDDAASGIVTREKQGRTDLLRPPGWFLLAEATDLAALEAARLAEALIAAGAREVAAASWRLEQALA